MRIIPFTERYRQDFISFNTDWIIDNFGFLEQEDLDTFDRIDEEIGSGAMIYIAVDDQGNALACCMARPMDNGRWELCKFASNKHLPHRGAGSAVFGACIDYAVVHGATELFLLSNSRLKAALHIYQKFGFRQIRLDDYEYERGDIAFVRSVAQGAKYNIA